MATALMISPQTRQALVSSLMPDTHRFRGRGDYALAPDLQQLTNA